MELLVSWFRFLVKMVVGEDEYHWHELTVFIHQLDVGHITVICFDFPDDDDDDDVGARYSAEPGNDNTVGGWSSPQTEYTKPTKRFNFVRAVRSELQAHPSPSIDWRHMQALLLRLAVIVGDRGVWAIAK